MLKKTPNTGGISVDTVFDVLAHRERRAIIERLAAEDEPLSIPALVERYTATMNADARPEHFAIRLHHQHLPKLQQADVVEHHPGSDRLTLTSTGRTVEAVRRQTAELPDTR
jgi:ribosomal protein S19E (S16A)